MLQNMFSWKVAKCTCLFVCFNFGVASNIHLHIYKYTYIYIYICLSPFTVNSCQRAAAPRQPFRSFCRGGCPFGGWGCAAVRCGVHCFRPLFLEQTLEELFVIFSYCLLVSWSSTLLLIVTRSQFRGTSMHITLFFLISCWYWGEGSAITMGSRRVIVTKTHGPEPREVSEPFQAFRTKVQKRSFKRAAKRAHTHGYTWYRGRLMSHSMFGYNAPTSAPDRQHSANINTPPPTDIRALLVFHGMLVDYQHTIGISCNIGCKNTLWTF